MNCASFAKLTVLAAFSGVAMANQAPPPERTTPPQVAFLDAAKAACWSRAYDAAHIAKHPGQKVMGIAFAYVPEKLFPGEAAPLPLWDQYSEEPGFSANVAVALKGEAGVLLGSAYCRAGGAKKLNCGIEGDGGSFTLTVQTDGGVMLDNPQGFSVQRLGVGTEEAEEYILIDPRDDHRDFKMPVAKGGLCDVDWPAEP